MPRHDRATTRLQASMMCLIGALLVQTVVAPARLVASGDDTSAVAAPAAGLARLTDPGRPAEIPFDIYRGDIRFRCEVNGHPVNLLLDDGFMWDQLLFWGGPEVDSLDLVYDGEISIGNDRSDRLQSRTASGITVTFPGAEFTEQTAVITPAASGVSSMWSGSAGQISAALFKHFVVAVDFDRNVIRLFEPESFVYSGQGTAVPWTPMGFGPQSIPATLHTFDGRRVMMDLLMDLGYNDQLQLVVDGEHGLPLPQEKLPAGLGVNIQGQETRGYMGRLQAIELGGYRIDNLLVSYVPEENADFAVSEAMIGLGLLSRFNLVFDFARARLFLKPNDSFNLPFDAGMTGFVSRPTADGQYEITTVYPDSPASDAGLHVGDRIVRIDDRPIGDYDVSELQTLYRQAGARVKLGVDREGRSMTVQLVLRRII